MNKNGRVSLNRLRLKLNIMYWMKSSENMKITAVTIMLIFHFILYSNRI